MGSKYLAAVVLAAVVVAACGGDDAGNTAAGDAESGAATTTTAAPAGEPGDAVTTTAAPAGDPGDATTTTAAPAGGSGAVVTIDGEEFSLDQQVVCVTMGGALGAQFSTADGALTLHVDLPPPGWETSADGWEPPSVRFDDERDDAYLQWEAGGEVLAGMSGVPDGIEVTAYSVDGQAASGAATVVDVTSVMVGDPVTADLAFEVACS